MPIIKGRHRWLVVAVLAMLLVASCTSDDDTETSAGDGDGTTTSLDVEAVEGCGEDSWTDPEDLDPDREPARCEPGTPAPDPLPERKTLRVVLNNLSSEYVAPLVHAARNGAFEEENLDVKLETIPVADAFPLLANGEIHALYSGPNAGFVNAVAGGFDLTWVTGNFFPDEESKTGLWVSVPEGGSKSRKDLLAGLDGSVMASVSGPGTVISYPVAEALEEADLTFGDLQIQTMPFADIVTALENGSVYSGWVVDPLWRRLEDNPKVQFLVGQPPGEPLGGMLFGPALAEDRETAVAFLRAFIRTINTHFRGDYKSDPAFVKELATLLNTPEQILRETPSLRWDWEIRAGTIERMQDAYLQEGALPSGKALPESRLVDRSFYEEAVGHRR